MLQTLVILFYISIGGGLASVIMSTIMQFTTSPLAIWAVSLQQKQKLAMGVLATILCLVLALFLQLEWMALVFRIANQIVKVNQGAIGWLIWIGFFCLAMSTTVKLSRHQREIDAIPDDYAKSAVQRHQNVIALTVWFALIYWPLMCFIPSASTAPLWWMPDYPWLRS